MQKVIVTGGAGFIGSNIVRELIHLGYHVRVIDNLSNGRRKNLADVEKDIEFIEADIRDLDVLQQAFRGFDYVLHQAALGSIPRSIDRPRDSNDTNVTGTLNVLIASRDQGIRRVVCASSSSIYGNREDPQTHKQIAKVETMKPMPLAPYPVTKLAGELYVKVFAHIYNLSAIVLRYFNVFGPRQNPNLQYAAVIPLFIKAMLRGEQPKVFGTGEQSRDFTYVANTIEANLLAMNTTVHEGETINIACGQTISLLEVISNINDILGTSIEPIFAPPRTGDLKNSLANIRKAKALIGYEPIVSFREGLERTVAWYREHLNDPDY